MTRLQSANGIDLEIRHYPRHVALSIGGRVALVPKSELIGAINEDAEVSQSLKSQDVREEQGRVLLEVSGR